MFQIYLMVFISANFRMERSKSPVNSLNTNYNIMKAINHTLRLSKKLLVGAKNIYFFLIVMALGVNISPTHSQIVPSSCSAPANLIEDYKLDAIQLTIRKLIDQNLP